MESLHSELSKANEEISALKNAQKRILSELSKEKERIASLENGVKARKRKSDEEYLTLQNKIVKLKSKVEVGWGWDTLNEEWNIQRFEEKLISSKSIHLDASLSSYKMRVRLNINNNPNHDRSVVSLSIYDSEGSDVLPTIIEGSRLTMVANTGYDDLMMEFPRDFIIDESGNGNVGRKKLSIVLSSKLVAGTRTGLFYYLFESFIRPW